jgi:hypothetical protein
MLYLVLFSTLAVGFYVASSLSTQVSRNERSSTIAQQGAESGMEYMRYQLGAMTIPPGTTNDTLLATVYGLLSTSLNGGPNMGTDVVTMSNGKIYIPGNTSHFIMLDRRIGAAFQATVEQSGDKLLCTVMGSSGTSTSVQRGVQLSFKNAPKASAIFNYGVASKGKVVTGGASYILGSPDPALGSVLSTSSDATPVIIGGKQVSGDISITNATGSVSYSGASIGGTTDPVKIADHIHKGVADPAFPTVDSTVYTNAVTLTAFAGGKTLTNMYIPAGTNPTFSGNTTVNGVLLIKAPNVVTFAGNTTITGVIVTDNNVAFNSTSNVINFSGNVKASGVQALPNTAAYANLRSLTGAFLLAPGFNVSFSGNFGTVAGSIIAGAVSMTGNAGGTVQGSVITTEDQPLTLNGSADITVASTGTSNYPAGVSFGSYYSPLPDTYVEIVP